MNELLKDIEKAFANWNERSMFTLRGVKNLSVSDLELLELYAEQNGIGLMKPLGDIARVLEKYGYVHKGGF